MNDPNSGIPDPGPPAQQPPRGDPPPPPTPDPERAATSDSGDQPLRGLLRGVLGGVRQMGRDMASVVLGRIREAETHTPEDDAIVEDPLAPEKRRRVGMLHSVAEQLRGAADTYVAAKLDEIEARVDVKLDHIEQRIDRKILELHEQLTQLRDAELRHRLRLLKITLVFTVLVAALSLVYKWASNLWFAS
ncbi:MAG: hypothetical protein IPM18_10520 [Phycisphaerales bacterium]|nr:hypothetical protein [Phycisphaerales bacterium]